MRFEFTRWLFLERNSRNAIRPHAVGHCIQTAIVYAFVFIVFASGENKLHVLLHCVHFECAIRLVSIFLFFFYFHLNGENVH